MTTFEMPTIRAKCNRQGFVPEWTFFHTWNMWPLIDFILIQLFRGQNVITKTIVGLNFDIAGQTEMG